MTQLLTDVVTGAEETARILPIPAVAYGLLAFVGLMTLLFVAFAFRSVGTRH